MVLGVSVAHLSCGNLGRLWGRLKVNSQECPPWDKLKEAIFWKNSIKYQRLWDLLKGDIRRPTGQFQPTMATDSGNVTTATFDFTQEGKEVTKTAAWGGMEALVEHRKIHLLWCEVGSEGLPAGVEAVFETHRDCYLMLVGVEDGMFKAMAQLNSIKNKQATLLQYKTAMVYVHMKEDPPLGPRVPPQVTVTRKVLLASPTPLKPHRGFVTMDYPWRPAPDFPL